MVGTGFYFVAILAIVYIQIILEIFLPLIETQFFIATQSFRDVDLEGKFCRFST